MYYLVITVIILCVVIVYDFYRTEKKEEEYMRETREAKLEEFNKWYREQEASPKYCIRIKTITGDVLESISYECEWEGLSTRYWRTSKEVALSALKSKDMFISRDGVYVSQDAIVLRQLVKERV